MWGTESTVEHYNETNFVAPRLRHFLGEIWVNYYHTASNAGQSSREKDVRSSVCRTRGLWQNWRNYCTKDHSVQFSEKKEWLVGGDPFYLKFWVNRPPRSKITDFEPIFARSASAVTPKEKSSINTNRKITSPFPMSLRLSSYIALKPHFGRLKNAKRPFSV